VDKPDKPRSQPIATRLASNLARSSITSLKRPRGLADTKDSENPNEFGRCSARCIACLAKSGIHPIGRPFMTRRLSYNFLEDGE
jgi:hypothetical protein